MTFLPIVERELRVASRRRGTYWGRLGASVLAIALFVFIYGLMFTEAPHEMSKVIFGVIAGVCFLFSLLAGVRATADSLSSEKREGTLGLLFLTDLRGFDVVLGKLAATSLNTFYSLLAVFPVLAVSLLLGGVTRDEVGRMVLVLVNTLLFSLAAGMFCSAITRNARGAMSATFLLIALINAIPPLAGVIEAAVRDANAVRPAYLISSAGFAFALSFDFIYPLMKQQFWVSCAITHGCTWLFLVTASLLAPYSWQDRPGGARRLRWRERWKQWCYGDTVERARFRASLLDVNPMFWLSSRERIKPAMVWGFLGLLGVGWVWGAFKVGRDWFAQETYVMTAFLLHSTLKLWLGAEAGQRFVEDRRNSALELLLSTPLTVAEVLRGQFLAMRRNFLRPLILVLALDVVFLLLPVINQGWSEDNAIWVWMFVVGIIMLVADMFTLFWVGLWMGLAARHPNRVAGSTIAWVLTLPWAVWMMFFVMLVFLNAHRVFQPSTQFAIGLILFLSLANDLAACLFCRRALHRHLRELAVQRVTYARGWAKFWPWGGSPKPPPAES